MKNKWIITSAILSNIILSVISFKIGHSISKKKYFPKKIDGEIFIDYTENQKSPAMYLTNVDPKTFNDSTKYVIIGVNHVRK